MLKTLEQIARRAGDLALSFAAKRDFEIEAKGPLDLVTLADRSVEALLLAELSAAFPEDGVVGEEGTGVRPEARRQWIIDPIDGTFNFVRGLPDWAISIGLIVDGRPQAGAVFAPVRDQMLLGSAAEGAWLNGAVLPPAQPFVREVGVISLGLSSRLALPHELALITGIRRDLRISYRSGGSTAVALMQLAEGQIDAMLGLGNRAWDIAGGMGAMAALGFADTVDFTAAPYGAALDFVIGKPELVAEARALLP